MTDNTVYEVIDRVDTSAGGGPTSSFYTKTDTVESVGSSTPDDTAYTVVDRVDTQAGSPTSSFYEAGTVYEDLVLSDGVLAECEAARDDAVAAAASIVPTVNAAVLVETNNRIAADAALQTAYIAADAVVSAAFADADALKAPLASPAFSGTPTGPTATVGTNTTQLATTAFVLANGSSVPPATVNPLMDGTAAVGTTTKYAREDHVHPTDTSRAPLASPGFSGTPTAPTATAGTNTTQLATTAFVDAARVILVAADDTKAPLASPALTGTPTAPTASPGTNTTQLATTAYADAIAALKANLASPTFTGTPAAPTATPGTNTTQLATTAFVLANAASFPATTAMLFAQTSAPTGWTKSTTHNDKALRVVSGTASSGGTNSFSTVMAQTTVGATTLTTAQIPAHNHPTYADSGARADSVGGTTYPLLTLTGGNTGNNTGGGGSHNHSITMAMQYVDVIIATKD